MTEPASEIASESSVDETPEDASAVEQIAALLPGDDSVEEPSKAEPEETSEDTGGIEVTEDAVQDADGVESDEDGEEEAPDREPVEWSAELISSREDWAEDDLKEAASWIQEQAQLASDRQGKLDKGFGDVKARERAAKEREANAKTAVHEALVLRDNLIKDLRDLRSNDRNASIHALGRLFDGDPARIIEDLTVHIAEHGIDGAREFGRRREQELERNEVQQLRQELQEMKAAQERKVVQAEQERLSTEQFSSDLASLMVDEGRYPYLAEYANAHGNQAVHDELFAMAKREVDAQARSGRDYSLTADQACAMAERMILMELQKQEASSAPERGAGQAPSADAKQKPAVRRSPRNKPKNVEPSADEGEVRESDILQQMADLISPQLG